MQDESVLKSSAKTTKQIALRLVQRSAGRETWIPPQTEVWEWTKEWCASMSKKKLGLSAYYGKRSVLEDDIHTEPIEFHMEVEKLERELWEMPWGRRHLGVGRHDKKTLGNKATLGAVLQIIQNRFIWAWWLVFRCRTLSKTRSDLWLFSFRPQAHRVGRDSEKPSRKGSTFHARQQVWRKKSQAWNKRLFLWWLHQASCRLPKWRPRREATPPIRKDFGPWAASFRLHTGSRTGAKQGCGWIFRRWPGRGEYPPSRLECSMCVFDLFGDTTLEFASMVHLQKLWLFQRPAFVNFLKSAWYLSLFFRGQEFSLFETAGHIGDGQIVFVCFSVPAIPHGVVRKKKEVCLVNCVWRGHIEFGASNVFWRKKIDLPKGLAYQPFVAPFSETFAAAASVSSSLEGCSKFWKA